MSEQTVVKLEEVQKPQEQPKEPEKPLVDDKGVEYKNRIAELQRKLDSAEKDRQSLMEQHDTLKQRLDDIEARNKPVEEEDETQKGWKEVERRAEERARSVYQQEAKANNMMLREIGKLEKDSDIGDLVSKYRSEIEDKFTDLSLVFRLKPESLQRVVDMVLGNHVKDELKTRRASETPPEEVRTSIASSPRSKPVTSDELTADEESFADKRGYFEKDYTNAEIKERYKKFKERNKK